MSILYRYSRDIHLSQDLLQETFISIFKNLDQFNTDKGSFKSWSSRIAINMYLQNTRARKITLFPINDQVLCDTDNIIDKLTVEEVRATIHLLSEQDRDMLNLYYFDEFSHQEIAQLLNIEVSSSRSKLSRARKSLAAKWSTINLKKTS